MTLPNATTEELLQEIALELAFAATGGKQSIVTMLDALRQLKQACQGHKNTSLAEAIAELLASLVPLTAESADIGQGEFETLQTQYLALEKAFYANQPQPEEPRLTPALEETTGSREEERAMEPSLRITVDNKDDLELLNEFCNEGRDLLSQVEQGVLILEEQPDHRETLNQVFRAFHTFKGGAGFLALDPIKNLAHILESLLDAARQDTLEIDRHVINLILAGGDTLRQFVDAIELSIRGGNSSTPIVVATNDLIAKVETTLAQGSPKTEEISVEDEIKQPSTKQVLNPIKDPKEKELAIPPATNTRPEPRQEDTQVTKLTSPSKIKNERLSTFVKIETEKLDALIDLVGELVIAKSMVVEHPLIAGNQSDDLPRHLRQLTRICTDLQRNAMSLRMVPIRTTFQKMNRLVRDLGSSQDKEISLLLKGEETELDRNIVEALAEPMIHMLRNSIDHGIERPEERITRGKPPQGKIEVEACHQGGGILIKVADDGRGIDPDKVLDKAIAQGLVESDYNGSINDILSLIFQPGFSTAETITDVSGRGVGMDVVRGSISRLRGRIDVESVVGVGTTFRIYLPLTLAIIDGMIVGVGEQRFIIPTLAIHESFKPTPTMLSTVKGRGQLVNLRGTLIPLMELAVKLGLHKTQKDPIEGIVLVIDSAGQQRGILVDRLISKQEVVIKAIGETFQTQSLYSGAAIMGDGQVALILDPDALGQTEFQRRGQVKASVN